MQIIKKVVTLLCCMLMILTGCSAPEKGEGLSIVCSAFPQYDWVRSIMGEKFSDATVTLLAENGEDLHSYQPSVAEIAMISSCDIFIYAGGASDSALAKAAENPQNSDMIKINMVDIAGECEDGHIHMTECDEHVWLSLKKAMALAEEISRAICLADNENAEIYKKNTEKYVAELEKLDSEFETMIKNADTNEIIFCDRYPFSYLAEDYGLKVYAAFEGCSADSEVSFDRIIYLAEKADVINASAVFTVENSDNKLAQTVISNMKNNGCDIKILDSCQSVTAGETGKTYLSVMENNMAVLKSVLYKDGAN